MFTTFGGDIHIRGKQGQPTLNRLVNLALQVAGENALPKVPRSLPLELGSAMHDGSFKYDLSTLLRTGEANFTGNAIVDGNQLLGPVLGLFQALYYLGKASTHIDEEAPANLQGDGGLLKGPQWALSDKHGNGYIADAGNGKIRLVSQPQLSASPQTTQDTGQLPTMVTYQYTGTVQTFTVPAGVTLIQIRAAGAAGGGGFNSNEWGTGGLGGYISTLLSVVPGQVYYVMVGGMGASRNSGYGIDHSSGGYNGGGPCTNPNTGEGGGGTDLRTSASDVSTRVVVSGGGE